MKHLTTIRENSEAQQLVWPAHDHYGWVGQNTFLDLHNQIKPYLRGRNTMVQAGGNCGLVLNTFVDMFDTIYTFEPEPLNFYCLVQNVSSSNVIKMQACLGDRTGLVGIQPLAAHAVDIGGYHVSAEPCTIPMLTVDSLDLKHCDLLQLDVEGGEYTALKGATNTIEKFKPVICIEVMGIYLNRYGKSEDDLFDLMKELGYKEQAIYGSDHIYTHQ